MAQYTFNLFNGRYSFLQHIYGALTGNKEILADINDYQPWEEAVLCFTLFTIINSALLMFILNIKYQALSNLDLPYMIGNIELSTLIKPASFSAYLGTQTWQVLLIIFGALFFWIAGSAIVYSFSRLMKGESTILSTISVAGFLMPLYSVFMLIYLVFTIAINSQSTALLFATLALIIILFIWFIKAVYSGLKVVANFTASKARISIVLALISKAIVLIIIWMLFNEYMFITVSSIK